MLNSPGRTNSSTKRLSAKPHLAVFVIVFLCLVNLAVYFPSIGGYFLADDFMHISYLSHVFNGHMASLLTNFYTNWMQATGTEFYRPLITLSLALDYLFWRNNAVGYHLSNLFFHTSSTILLYFLIGRVAGSLGNRQANALAFVSAVFFAVYPLHPEVVSWIIGRVDSVATMFYLAAFLLFLKYEDSCVKQSAGQSFRSLSLSLLCFLLSLLSKEIAITLPISLWLWDFMFANGENKLWVRITLSLKRTLPYWLLLGVYLVIRALSLGTICGGYSGSLGAALDISLFKRFIEEPALLRLILPFNDELFSPRHFLRRGLNVLYGLSVVAFCLRLFLKGSFQTPVKLMVYSFLWFAVSLLPTFQVFGLTPNLQGSRLVYLASVPICFLFALFLVPLRNTGDDGVLAGNVNAANWQQIAAKITEVFCLVLCVATLFSFTWITYTNNLPWRRAGDELRELQNALLNEAARIAPNKKVLLLNMPHSYKGAHMLYNGTTLDLLCSPVLSGRNTSYKIVTFEPPLFGYPDLLNFARLQRWVAIKDHFAIVTWKNDLSDAIGHRHGFSDVVNEYMGKSSSHKFLKEIDIENSAGSLALSMPEKVSKDDGQIEFVTLTNLNISPLKFGLLQVSIKSDALNNNLGQAKSARLQLQWFSSDPNAVIKNGALVQPLIADGRVHNYLFNLNEHKSWVLCNRINQLKISAPFGKYKLEIEDMRFLNPAYKIPQLGSDYKIGPYEDDAGIFHFAHHEGFYFKYDATQVKGAYAVIYEISKPNFWFEDEDNTFTNSRLSNNVAVRQELPNLKGEFTISGKDLKTGYFEIHLAAVDKDGHMVGLTSYPVCGQVGEP